MMDPITAKLFDYGLSGLLLACAIVYHLKVIRPDVKQRELERDKLMSERLQAVLDQMRHQSEEHSAERSRLTAEHSKNWEEQRKQSREDKESAREERAEDRKLFRDMIAGLGASLEALHKGQDRGFALTLALGEGQGRTKRELINRTETISQQKVDPKFRADETHP